MNMLLPRSATVMSTGHNVLPCAHSLAPPPLALNKHTFHYFSRTPNAPPPLPPPKTVDAAQEENLSKASAKARRCDREKLEAEEISDSYNRELQALRASMRSMRLGQDPLDESVEVSRLQAVRYDCP